jgi:hypothetical protein
MPTDNYFPVKINSLIKQMILQKAGLIKSIIGKNDGEIPLRNLAPVTRRVAEIIN